MKKLKIYRKFVNKKLQTVVYLSEKIEVLHKEYTLFFIARLNDNIIYDNLMLSKGSYKIIGNTLTIISDIKEIFREEK